LHHVNKAEKFGHNSFAVKKGMSEASAEENKGGESEEKKKS
jgi:hypothetical protein